MTRRKFTDDELFWGWLVITLILIGLGIGGV